MAAEKHIQNTEGEKESTHGYTETHFGLSENNAQLCLQ